MIKLGKKPLAILLATVLLLCASPLTALAADIDFGSVQDGATQGSHGYDYNSANGNTITTGDANNSITGDGSNYGLHFTNNDASVTVVGDTTVGHGIEADGNLTITGNTNDTTPNDTLTVTGDNSPGIEAYGLTIGGGVTVDATGDGDWNQNVGNPGVYAYNVNVNNGVLTGTGAGANGAPGSVPGEGVDADYVYVGGARVYPQGQSATLSHSAGANPGSTPTGAGNPVEAPGNKNSATIQAKGNAVTIGGEPLEALAAKGMGLTISLDEDIEGVNQIDFDPGAVRKLADLLAAQDTPDAPDTPDAQGTPDAQDSLSDLLGSKAEPGSNAAPEGVQGTWDEANQSLNDATSVLDAQAMMGKQSGDHQSNGDVSRAQKGVQLVDTMVNSTADSQVAMAGTAQDAQGMTPGTTMQPVNATVNSAAGTREQMVTYQHTGTLGTQDAAQGTDAQKIVPDAQMKALNISVSVDASPNADGRSYKPYGEIAGVIAKNGIVSLKKEDIQQTQDGKIMSVGVGTPTGVICVIKFNFKLGLI